MFLRRNFLHGTVTDNPLLTASANINSAEFVDLPVVGGGDRMKLVLDPLSVNGDPEIVYITTHLATTTVVTVERGQEGTIARDHPVNTVWNHGVTSKDFALDVGDIKLTASQFLNPRWLRCDGSEVDRSVYPRLFNEIGETFGNGDGTVTFNLPDFTGRVPSGVGALGSDVYALGDQFGEASVDLTSGQMPSHNHSLAGSHTHPAGNLATNSTGSHDHGGTTGAAGGHDHGLQTKDGTGKVIGFPPTYILLNPSGGGVLDTNITDTANETPHSHVISPPNLHNHTVSGNLATGGAGNAKNTGGGSAHENRQPSLVVDYFIFAG